MVHLDNYSASINIVPRNCASAHLGTSSTGTKSRSLINIIPRLHQLSINITPGLAKSAPCSPLPSTGTLTLTASCYHDRRRATQPPFIAGPLCLSVNTFQDFDCNCNKCLSITPNKIICRPKG